MKACIVLLSVSIFLAIRVEGHARLRIPSSRSSMWRDGFPTPPNYNDHELNCGGMSVSNDTKRNRKRRHLTRWFDPCMLSTKYQRHAMSSFKQNINAHFFACIHPPQQLKWQNLKDISHS